MAPVTVLLVAQFLQDLAQGFPATAGGGPRSARLPFAGVHDPPR